MPLPIDTNVKYATCEYLLVLQPHADLNEKIMQVKKNFAETYECPAAVFSKPHITLIKFHQYELAEDRIVRRMKSITSGCGAFKVELNGFGSFPTHTIYINVATKNNIVELVKRLKDVQRILKLDDDHKPHFITAPHITVARKLLPWQYEKGWLEYSNTHFSGMFMADHLLLLKKRTGAPKFQQVCRFELENVKQSSKQGSLFA
ncbi:2'-5' RNA ligase family protein [Chitinophagaceae bacterium LWZ2-11]